MSMPDGGLYRPWKDGAAKVPGFLDDYAFLTNALIDLYESGFDRRYLEHAQRLCDLILDKFWDDGFYFTPKEGERLVHRPRSPHDPAWPSGTSASVFARLHELTGRDSYHDRAEQVFQMYGAAASPGGVDFAQRPVSIVLAGGRDDTAPLVEAVHRTYRPALVLAFAEDVPIGQGRHPVGSQLAAYLCRSRSCDAPVTSAKALLEYCTA
ncbi:MAG TPA: hypothetical protein DCL72_02660 [Rhizobiales bacterium]|nr:hypothetical protein [Hyphomicrobiales bacterium]